MIGLGKPLSRRATLSGAGASLLTALCPLSSPRAKIRPAVPTGGVNITGWLDREEGSAPSEAVLEKLWASGFRTIRLPIDGEFALAGAAALRRIREAIEKLVSMGFSALADMHPSSGLNAALRGDPLSGGKRVNEAWTALRAVIADLPADKVYPELLNEPPMDHAGWLPLRDRLAETVRKTCPDHAIVWGPAPDQGIWQLDSTPALTDDRQIAAVHFYAPMAFTHQCQSWGRSALARISGLPFPATRNMPRVGERIAALRAAGDEEAAALVEDQLKTDWTDTAIQTEFARAARWSAATGCPVMLNEFGVLDMCVDAQSRVNWIRAVRKAAEMHGIGWAIWELDQGFGFTSGRSSTEAFDGAIMDALFGREG